MGQMPGGLTLKQDRFIDAYIENGGNGRQAYLASYDPDSVPAVLDANASRLLSYEKVRSELLRRLSLDKPLDEKLAKVLDDALLANGPDAQPDHSVRLKALTEASKIAGLYAPSESESRHVSVDVQVDGAVAAFLMAHGRYPTIAEMPMATVKPDDTPRKALSGKASTHAPRKGTTGKGSRAVKSRATGKR